MKKTIMIALMLIAQTGFALEQSIDCTTLDQTEIISNVTLDVKQARGFSYFLKYDDENIFLNEKPFDFKSGSYGIKKFAPPNKEEGITELVLIESVEMKAFNADLDIPKSRVIDIDLIKDIPDRRVDVPIDDNFNKHSKYHPGTFCPSKLTFDHCIKLGLFKGAKESKKYKLIINQNNKLLSYSCQ